MIVTLKWHGTLPNMDLAQLELDVLNDISQNLTSLKKPSYLVFHTVFLGEDYDGPNVCVWGEENDDAHFHCQYYEKTEWVTANGEPANV